MEERKLNGEIFCGGLSGRSDQRDKKHRRRDTRLALQLVLRLACWSIAEIIDFDDLKHLDR
jgi:hypothetical protein